MSTNSHSKKKAQQEALNTVKSHRNTKPNKFIGDKGDVTIVKTNNKNRNLSATH